MTAKLQTGLFTIYLIYYLLFSHMTTDATQREIVDEFSFFEDWMERYQYLIDLGRKLPALAPEEMTDDRLLEGCQSSVWFIVEGDADRLTYRANSDAAIVSGLIALLLRVFSGHSAREFSTPTPGSSTRSV